MLRIFQYAVGSIAIVSMLCMLLSHREVRYRNDAPDEPWTFWQRLGPAMDYGLISAILSGVPIGLLLAILFGYEALRHDVAAGVRAVYSELPFAAILFVFYFLLVTVGDLESSSMQSDTLAELNAKKLRAAEGLRPEGEVAEYQAADHHDVAAVR